MANAIPAGQQETVVTEATEAVTTETQAPEVAVETKAQPKASTKKPKAEAAKEGAYDMGNGILREDY